MCVCVCETAAFCDWLKIYPVRGKEATDNIYWFWLHGKNFF